ncbi:MULTISPECIES: hypothetical protein [Glycomyces]|uniref:Uncharacterized protein n=2 Tax=Glycomyces TaxID=58113 RepID=A0A9X3PLG3_9ACTN|nr:hypothetical protein [Glycomyces lechevalierae]MDA1387609.1 hypothetical protein [Glycomyces lechevalierae]MDR7336625.1 hypothetical protein [Glycomyces lechevalierae]
MAQRLGEPAPVRKEAPARSPRPDAEAVLEALQRINDPRRRLVEEWFRLWPTGRRGGTETQVRHPAQRPARHHSRHGRAPAALERGERPLTVPAIIGDR